MKPNPKALEITKKLAEPGTKMGDLRKIAKEIKVDHELGLELWNSSAYLPRLLASLILDNKQLNQESIDQLTVDMQAHPEEEKLQLIDWLLANQLSKNKKTVALMTSWEKSDYPLQRRLFWYHQARLRWMGKTDHPNTEQLLESIEKNLLQEEPEVQWAMNYTAGQIGKFEEKYRNRCIAIGENTGLYKDEIVAKNCTPSYLPKFIAIEVAKLKK